LTYFSDHIIITLENRISVSCNLTDKGKPIERWGRKATGLKLGTVQAMIARLPKQGFIIYTCILGLAGDFLLRQLR